MPSTALTKTMNASRLSVIADKLLYILEKVSDETFWSSFFSERVLNLLKRYFGSDVIFLGMIVYIAPIIGYQFNSLFYYIVSRTKERMYVSIQISQNEAGYEAIQQFIASQTSSIRNLRDVEGRCREDEDDDSLQIMATPPPKLHLYPLNGSENKITYKGHTLWVVKKKDSANGPNPPNYFYGESFKDIMGMMATSPCIQITMKGQDLNFLKSLIQEWINEYYEKDREKLNIYKCLPDRYDCFTWRSYGAKDVLRTLDSVILKEGQKEVLLKDIQSFRRRREWYNDRGIPYRRGYLLYGPPGTGKTSLVQSIASKANMNIAIISLSGKMTDDQFTSSLEDVPRNSILLMEDIDHCIVKKDGKEEGTTKVTMNTLLNALDGVAAPEGSMVFMTCNDINRVQPALLRPGRIDVKMELGYADKLQIREMFYRFMDFDSSFKKSKSDEEVVPEVDQKAKERLNETADTFTSLIPDLQVTPAELQNFFIMSLMEQEELEDEELKTDPAFVLDKVPEFLKSVRRDREQALDYNAGVDFTIKAITTSMARSAEEEKTTDEEDTHTVVGETANKTQKLLDTVEEAAATTAA